MVTSSALWEQKPLQREVENSAWAQTDPSLNHSPSELMKEWGQNIKQRLRSNAAEVSLDTKSYLRQD